MLALPWISVGCGAERQRAWEAPGTRGRKAGDGHSKPPTAISQGRLVILDMHVRQVWLLDTASAAASADTYGGSFSWSMRAPDGQQAGYVLPGPLVTDGGDPVSPTARVSLVRGWEGLVFQVLAKLCARLVVLLCIVPRLP